MESLQPRSLADEAYGRLRNAIVSGELAEGTRLREEEIAAQLRLSRTPVREALHRLEADGLIETPSGRTAFVKVLTAQDALSVYDVYQVLARYAFELGAKHLEPADHDAIDARLEAFTVLAPVDRIAAHDMLEQAWAVVYAHAMNPEVLRILDSLRPRVQRLVETRYPEGLLQPAATNYRKMLSALRRGAIDAALDIFDRDYAAMRAAVLARFTDAEQAPANGAGATAAAASQPTPR